MTFRLASRCRPALRDQGSIWRPNRAIFGFMLLAFAALTLAEGTSADDSAIAIDNATGAVYSASRSGVVIRHIAGKEIWRANLGLSPKDRVLSLTPSRSGEVYAAGSSGQLGFLIKLAPDGSRQAAITTGAPARAVSVDDAGTIWLGGDGFVTRLDAQLRPVVNVSAEGSVVSLATDRNDSVYTAIAAASNSAVGKLSADGRTWLWRVDLGGGTPRAVAVDDAGSVYVAGAAGPAGLRMAGAPQDQVSGMSDVFVARLNAKGGVVWTKYVGGTGKDSPASIVANRDGTLLVAGTTTSPDFPFAGERKSGNAAGFLARLDSDGKLVDSEYIEQPVDAQVRMAGAVNHGDTAALITRAALRAGPQAAADPCNIVVTNTNDSGEGSLRQAVADAACTTIPRITFGVQGVITLSSRILLNKSLNIDGPGVSDLIISGNNATRIFFVGSGTTAPFSGEVNVSGLTLAGGFGRGGDGAAGAAGMGGAIFQNGGTLRLRNVLMTGNQAIGGNGSSRGGGGGFGGNGTTEVGGSGGDLGGAGGAEGTASNIAGGNGGDGGGGGSGYSPDRESGDPGGKGGNGGFGGGGGAGGRGGISAPTGFTGNGGFGGGTPAGSGAGAPGFGGALPGGAGFGGAIFSRKGLLQLSDSAFQDNSSVAGNAASSPASGKGGALFIYHDATPAPAPNEGATATSSNVHFLANVAAQASLDVNYSAYPVTLVRVCPGVDNVDVCGILSGDSRSSVAALVEGDNQTAFVNNPFPIRLKLRVTNSGNPVAGVPVAFTVIPAGGANAVFPGNVRIAVATTDSSGNATSPVLTAAGSPGSLSVRAAGLEFHLNVGTATITASPNTTPQTKAIETDFTPLSVTLKDNAGNPLTGRSVTFTAPSSGASGTFPNSAATVVVTTDSSGIASTAFRANAIIGSYQVTASGLGLSAAFSLTNTAGQPASITAASGTTPQSTNTLTLFAKPLAVTITDSRGNAVPGVSVTFTAPASGSSGTFANGTGTITVPTDTFGVASAPLTANGSGGTWTATASASGLASVWFSLTNNAAPAISTNPSDIAVEALATATFTAAASGYPKPSVRWQVSSDNGVTFTDVPGAIAATLTFATNGSQTGYKYRAVFTNALNSAISSAATLTVTKLTPSVTWNNPADIVFGTPLSSTQLNAATSTAGTFVYSPAAGTVLGAGAGQLLSVEFRPSDAANYKNAQATARINVLSQATATTVSAASGQYGDAVTLSASIAPAAPFAGLLQFQLAGANVGAPIPVSGGGNYSVTYNITNGAGSYPITAVLTTTSVNFAGSSGSSSLNVSREDAVITPADANPQTVQVSTPGGTAGPFTLTGTVAETTDGSPGDINKAVVAVSLIPAVAGTTNIPCAVTNTNGAISALCSTVPVNAYTVRWTIGSEYYQGSAVNTVLAVYDPAAGFVTGSGTVQDNGVAADFALSLKYAKSGALQGGLTFVAHRASGDVTVSTTSLTSMSIVGTTAVIIGQATVNGVGGYTLRATVTDNGEPGKNRDTFGLELTGGSLNPPVAFAPVAITTGNLQMH